MSPGLRLSVIVVSHDSGTWLQRCVAALLEQGEADEVVVVDNASRDGLLETLPTDPRLLVLRNADNRGFAVACNQGAARSRGAQLLFLNPDCEPVPGALGRLLEIAAATSGLGLLGAQLLNEDGSVQAASRRRTPTPWLALSALTRSRNALEVPPPQAGKSSGVEDVEAISGALMLVPRMLFERLGGFDEAYVLHCEDLDLCRRVLASGHRVALAPSVRIVHHKGTSSRRRPVWVEWQKHRGMLRYFRKFDAIASPWWLRLAVPVGVWLRFPFAALRAWGRAVRP